ncbi:EAL domain-containing protein [Cohnella sp. 56]
MLLGQHSDIAWWMNGTGAMLGCNEAFEAFFGSIAEKMSSLCFERIVSQKDLKRISGYFLKARTGRAQHLEAAFIHRDGREVMLRISFVPVYAGGKVIGLYSTAIPSRRDEAAWLEFAASCTEDRQTDSSSPLVRELGQAIDRNQLLVYYQPQLHIRTGRIMGVEALLRWQHPTLGIVSPGEFIPIAEETGQIIPIGEWVLRQACAQIKAWQDNGMEPFTVSVNLSPRQFEQSSIVDTVSAALTDTGLDARYLELEITEGMTMDVERSSATLNELKKLGVKISVDDFGIGYSSLNYLKRFPIDTLKIDQSFIRDCTTDESDAMIIKTIISMAHHLNMNVIAEGIETPEHLIFLQQHLCDEGQGYLFSRPLPADQFLQEYGRIGSVVESLGLSASLTDQMWIQEQLRATRHDLETTLRQQQGKIMKFREEHGKFIHSLCDGELLYRMGFTPGHIVGKELRDFLPPRTAERIESFYRKAWLGNDNVTYEDEINGIWYLSSLRPIRRGGRVVEVIGSAIDITQRKRAEEALRQMYARFRLIAENTTDLISVFDTDGKLQYASPSHEQLLGFALQSLEGKTLSDLIHPDDHNAAAAFFSEVVEKKKAGHEAFRLRHRDGGWVWVETGCTPVLGGDGRVERIISVGRDITVRKREDDQDEHSWKPAE